MLDTSCIHTQVTLSNPGSRTHINSRPVSHRLHPNHNVIFKTHDTYVIRCLDPAFCNGNIAATSQPRFFTNATFSGVNKVSRNYNSYASQT